VSHHVVVHKVQQESRRTARQWDGIGVSYGGVRGLVVALGFAYARPLYLGVYGAELEFDIENLDVVCVPLAEHAGCSFLRHPKSGSRTFDGGSAVKVVHRLD
jgi:hypothetical protein